MESWVLLLDIVQLLGLSLVFGAVCARFGQSSLVGCLLAGMILGPRGINVISSASSVEQISEIGIALLLFSLGLDFSLPRLIGLGIRSVLCGILQVVLTLAAAALVGWIAGLSRWEAITAGAMIALSSTAAVLQVLMDHGELDSPHGRVSLAVLLIQDLAVIPLALLLSFAAAHQNTEQLAASSLITAAAAAAFITLLYFVMNKGVKTALRGFARERNRDLSILLAFVAGLGAAWGAHRIGISPALGAFLAGMFLGGSPFAAQIRADLSSLRIVLMTLFFGSAGMIADPLWMIKNLPLVLLISSAIIAGKALIAAAIIISLRGLAGTAMATGLCLAQVGEFAFVLGSIGRTKGVLGDETYLPLVCSAIVTLFVTPYVVPLSASFGLAFSRIFGGKNSSPAVKNRGSLAAPEIVIVGFGPAGRSVGEALAKINRHVLVLDLNLEQLKEAEALGFSGAIADARNMDILESIPFQKTRLVVITIPSRAATMNVLNNFRQLASQAQIIIRARHEIHRVQFESAGACAVAGDETAVGEKLARLAVELLHETEVCAAS